MSKEYVIEDGIPVPPPMRGSGSRRKGLMGAIAQLEVGQSVLLVSNSTVKSTSQDIAWASASHCRRAGLVSPTAKFVVRKVEGGARIWRIA